MNKKSNKAFAKVPQSELDIMIEHATMINHVITLMGAARVNSSDHFLDHCKCIAVAHKFKEWKYD